MPSNTLCFNQHVQALQASKCMNVSSSQQQCGPSHGLLGDAGSQWKSGLQGMTSFRHSQVLKMREKAEVRVLAQDLPEVVIAQEFLPPPGDEPVGDFDAGGDAWVDQPSDSEDGEEEEGAEIEVTAWKFRVEY